MSSPYQIKLIVKASEMPPSNQSVTGTIIFTIINVNDELPQFSQPVCYAVIGGCLEFCGNFILDIILFRTITGNNLPLRPLIQVTGILMQKLIIYNMLHVTLILFKKNLHFNILC